jgi:hypothetical protein
MDGKGGGPMAGFLTGTLPDLTQLQKDNGGVFPVTRVYGVIDGSTELGPHGTREMPAWGNRYKLDAQEHLSYDFGPSRETYQSTNSPCNSTTEPGTDPPATIPVDSTSSSATDPSRS